MAAKHPVSVIFVSHNSAAVLPEAIRSVQDCEEILVVDNASSDASPALARACGARVIASAENLGFGAGCNLGAKAAAQPYLFFLNPDARAAPNALAELLRAARAHPDWGGINPNILDEAGRPQLHLRQTSRLLPKHENRPGQPPFEADAELVMLSGAALFVPREAFAAIGGFDPAIFLYFEDDDFALRLRHSGWKLGYAHGARVRHKGGESSALSPALLEFKAYHRMKAQLYALDKHGLAYPRRRRLHQFRLKRLFALLCARREAACQYAGYVRALAEAEAAP